MLKTRKEFIEPELVKCEESLEKVTLTNGGYNGTDPEPQPLPDKCTYRPWLPECK